MTTRPADRPLLTVPQAAVHLGISESAAYRWLDRGELPGAVHVGGRWWVRRRVLLAWLEGEEGPPKAQAA